MIGKEFRDFTFWVLGFGFSLLYNYKSFFDFFKMKARVHISAGTIIFRLNKAEKPTDATALRHSDISQPRKIVTAREYLLLLYPGGYWDFPKGTAEKGEQIKETALREAKEETGLDVEIIDGFEEKIRYFFRESPSANSGQATQLVFKQVIFFVAKSKSEKVKISDEHSDYIWLPFKKAIELLKHKTAKEILMKTERFLNKKWGFK
jgi:8-oxo-dGTP pyrophosphatase MutT (NUDIX family)